MPDAPDNPTRYADGMGRRALRANVVAIGDPIVGDLLMNQRVRERNKSASRATLGRDAVQRPMRHRLAYLRTEL
jgi:hypothetical protein